MSKDEKTIVSGGADSVITFWSDVTIEMQAAKAAEAEDLVLKCVSRSLPPMLI